jgi:hypothetical protein
MTEPVTLPLGTRYASGIDRDPRTRNAYTPDRLAVIGDVERAGAGNLILRVGQTLPAKDGPGWEGQLHLVLTPPEREYLMDLLERQHAETVAAEQKRLNPDLIAGGDETLSWITEFGVTSGSVQDLAQDYLHCDLGGYDNPTDVRAIADGRQVRVDVATRSTDRGDDWTTVVVSVTLPTGEVVEGSYRRDQRV